jgi:hypothetical protein
VKLSSSSVLIGRVLVTDVAVHIDQRRHDRLATEIDARGTGRRADLTGSPDARDAIALDDKGTVLDWVAPSPTMIRAPSNSVAVRVAASCAALPSDVHAAPETTHAKESNQRPRSSAIA